MKEFKTPQEKKMLSYQFDRRNVYGENSKSSRKAIHKRKQWVNQTYRQGIRHILNAPIDLGNIDKIEDKVKENKRPLWKKYADKPLGLYLNHKAKLNSDKIKKLVFKTRYKPVLATPHSNE